MQYNSIQGSWNQKKIFFKYLYQLVPCLRRWKSDLLGKQTHNFEVNKFILA